MKLKQILSNRLRQWAHHLDGTAYLKVETPFFTPDPPEDAVVEMTSEPVWSPEQEDGVVIVEPKIITIGRAEHGEEDLSKVSKPF